MTHKHDTINSHNISHNTYEYLGIKTVCILRIWTERPRQTHVDPDQQKERETECVRVSVVVCGCVRSCMRAFVRACVRSSSQLPVSLTAGQINSPASQSTKSVFPAQFALSIGSQTPGCESPVVNFGGVPGLHVHSGSPNSSPFVSPSPSESFIQISVSQI